MRTWHDFHITGYAVRGTQQEICFDLEWPYDTATDVKHARLTFEQVQAYFLEYDLGGNIVYAIQERPLREFLVEWAQKFDAESKWGWPKFWWPTPYPQCSLAEALEESFLALSAKGVTCSEISSSYGLSGRVLAAGVREEAISS